MISAELAREVAASGMLWLPSEGDLFIIDQPELQDQDFMISSMVVEVFDGHVGPEFRFNGTTEWALDTVETRDALWFPREDQLRDALGAAFVSLDRGDDGYVIAVELTTGVTHVRGAEPDEAYARAVIALLGSSREA